MDVRAMVVLHSWNGVPEDFVVHDWHFNAGDAAAWGNVVADLTTFYTVAPPGFADPLSDYLSGSISRSANVHEIKLYDVATTGSPVHEASLTLPAIEVGHKNLPSECAACLSFNANLVGVPEEGPPDPITGKITRPRARRRGRVFFGPLNDKGLQEGVDSGNDQMLSLTFRGALCAAAKRLGESPNSSWRVWSPTDGVSRVVDEGFVDNAIDIQRRRGARASARSTFDIV